MQIWAFRDLLRRPFEAFLFGITMTVTVAILGTLLLFPRAVHDTLNTLLKSTPSIILRRADATGFSPILVQTSVRVAENVVGVVSVRPRIWGLVNGPQGQLTIMGVRKDEMPKALADQLTQLPDPGQVIIGFGVSTGLSADTLQLEGAVSQNYQVIDRLPEKTSLFTHDLVLMDPDDARQLIGLPKDYATDLAIDVFHENEQEAILSDLIASFPWPVQCVTRLQSQGLSAGRWNRGRALVTIAVIPAVLALCLLVAVNTRKSMGRQSDLGIMKAMGWTTGNIVVFQLYRELFVCLPSAAAGICFSFLLVYGPGVGWLADFFLGWKTIPPSLYLETTGAATVVLEVTALILVPVIAAAFLPALKGATADVHCMIQDAGGR
ncbi:ABC transporter permease [Desulfocicer niacini]